MKSYTRQTDLKIYTRHSDKFSDITRTSKPKRNKHKLKDFVTF